MKLSRLLQIVEAGDYGGRLGFGARPDDTGIRSKGVNRKPDRRLGDFPYDRDITYGQPGKYDRGSSVHTSNHGTLTPKDDSTFSLTLMDLEEIVNEVMGSPMLLSRGGSSNLGSMVPGVNGGWANNPSKQWDDDEEVIYPEVTTEEDIYGSAPIPIRPEDQTGWEKFVDFGSINDFESLYDERPLVDPGHYAEMDFHVISPDPWTTINHNISSRGLKGVLPQQSAWDRISGMVLEPRKNSQD